MDRPAVLAADTSRAIEQRQIAAWRRMTSQQKLELVESLRRASLELARAGIRLRYPEASERECFLRLAVITLGEELARAAYPEASELDPA